MLLNEFAKHYFWCHQALPFHSKLTAPFKHLLHIHKLRHLNIAEDTGRVVLHILPHKFLSILLLILKPNYMSSLNEKPPLQ